MSLISLWSQLCDQVVSSSFSPWLLGVLSKHSVSPPNYRKAQWPALPSLARLLRELLWSRENRNSPLLERPHQSCIWDFQTTCLGYPRSPQKMLRFVRSMQLYSERFTSTQGPDWELLFMVCIVKGRGEKPHRVFLCYFKCLSTLRYQRWIFSEPYWTAVYYQVVFRDSWNCYHRMDPHNLWFSLGQIKITGKLENYFYMHICRTLGALFCFGKLVKCLFNFLAEAKFPWGYRERGAGPRGFRGAREALNITLGPLAS